MANSNIDYGVEYQDKNGAWIQAIAIATAAPLDYRLKVKYFSDLTNAETWQVQGTGSGNKGFNTAYHGMLSYVANDSDSGSSGLYVLTPGTAGSASADALVAANWVKISQTDATIEELRELINSKQSETISVSGLTGATVQAVLEDISARLAGAATGGNLEALGNRVTVVEGNVSALSAADTVFASDIATVSGAVDLVAADVETVSGAVDTVAADVATVSGKADANASAIETINTVTIPAVEAKVETVSGKADANASAIETINTVTIPAVEASVQVVSGAVDAVAADVETVSGVAVENAADIAEIQTALEDIYTKDETDSLITSAIADAATLEIVVWDGTIAELLQSVGETKKIYLVANSGNPNNAKDEYIYTSEGKWELIGTTATDLSNYFTKGETQSAIDTTVAGVSAGLQSGVEANAAAIKAINETTIPAVEADVDYVSGQVKSTIADVATVSGKADANASAIETINTVTIPAIEESIDDVAGDLELVAADVEEVSGKADANAEAIEEISTVTIPAVEANVATVSGKADANASEIAAVKATVETVSGKADANAAAIEAVAVDVEYVSGQVDASVEGIEDAIEAVAADVATVSGKADANAGLIAGLRSDVNTISGSVDAFNGRVDSLEAEHDSINSKIEAAEKDIDALEQADTLKANSDATNINAGLWKTALGIDTLEEAVAGNEEAVEAVAADVQIVSAKVDENSAAIATKASQVDLTAVEAKVDATSAIAITKASQADLTALTGRVEANEAAISQKASQADVSALSGNKQDKVIAIEGIVATTVEGALKELDNEVSYVAELVSGTGADNQGILGDIAGLKTDVETLSTSNSKKANDSEVVHLSGGETITGDLTISSTLTVGSGIVLAGTTVNGIDSAVTDSADKLPTSKAVKAEIDAVKELFTTSVIYKKVDELPAEGEKNVIYLVAEEGSTDVYVEYLFVDGEYERIGTTKADLSDYVTNESLSSTVSSINTELDGKASLSAANTFTGGNRFIDTLTVSGDPDNGSGNFIVEDGRGSSVSLLVSGGTATLGYTGNSNFTVNADYINTDYINLNGNDLSNILESKANADASNVATNKAAWKTALGFIEDSDASAKYVAKNSDAALNSVTVQNGSIISKVNGDCSEFTLVAQGTNSTTVEFTLPSSVDAYYVRDYGVFTCDYKSIGIHDVFQWASSQPNDVFIERQLRNNTVSLANWSVDTENKKVTLTFSESVSVQSLLRLTVAYFN